MAENSPELANLWDRPDSRSTKEGASDAAKPKKPFLKRGVGTQARITATQRKKYVPKGGFVLNLEAEQAAAEGPAHKSGSDRQIQPPPGPSPQVTSLQPQQASTAQQPGLLAAAAPATNDTTLARLSNHGLGAARAAHLGGHSRAAAHDPASGDAADQSVCLDHWAKPDSLLDPEGDIMEMQSETEMLLGSKCDAVQDHAMAGILHRPPAPPGTDPSQAQEVSGCRAQPCMCQ